jgi:hypothetical protein
MLARTGSRWPRSCRFRGQKGTRASASRGMLVSKLGGEIAYEGYHVFVSFLF